MNPTGLHAPLGYPLLCRHIRDVVPSIPQRLAYRYLV
jgi:hypothetical protein